MHYPYRRRLPSGKQLTVSRKHTVPGSGIAPRSISVRTRYLTPAQLKSVRLFAQRATYMRLRQAGFSPELARAYKNRIYEVDELIEMQRRSITEIAESKGVDPAIIASSLGMTSREPEHWERYTRARDYSLPEKQAARYTDDRDWELYLELGEWDVISEEDF